MFNGYKPDWTPLEIEIELYDIGTKVKTSAGRKGVIVETTIQIDIKAKPKFYGL